MEIDLEPRCDDHTLPEANQLSEWYRYLADATLRASRPIAYNHTTRQMLQTAGFIDIQVLEFKLPIGPWAARKNLRDAGLLQLSAMLEGIEGLSLRLLTTIAGWSLEEVKVLLAKVRTELKDKKCHAYWPVWVTRLSSTTSG